MKRALLIATLLCLAVPLAFAQGPENHGEFGIVGDYTRIGPTNTNFYGVGGRLSFNVSPHVQLEGDMAYDFNQSFSTSFTNTVSNGIPTLYQGNAHLWDAFFGPKFQTTGPIRFFATVKGGFVNFAGGNPSFNQQVASFGSGGTFGAMYPGVGMEAYLGPIGLRLDVGDEIYFNNGANNNLKIQFGPHIRF